LQQKQTILQKFHSNLDPALKTNSDDFFTIYIKNKGFFNFVQNHNAFLSFLFWKTYYPIFNPTVFFLSQSA